MKIKIHAQELINHDEAQVLLEKGETLRKFKYSLCKIIESNYGEFKFKNTNVSEKDSKNYEINNYFSNNNIELIINETTRSKNPSILNKLFDSANEEIIDYRVNISLEPKNFRQEDEWRKALYELTSEILSMQKNNRDMSIKYKPGALMPYIGF